MKKLTCFKAYDIRGKLGEELNEDIAWRIGRAYGEFLKPKTIVLGGDVRLTSETLKLALAKGLQDAGVDVLDIGMSGTEEIYFATFHLGVDGGIDCVRYAPRLACARTQGACRMRRRRARRNHPACLGAFRPLGLSQARKIAAAPPSRCCSGADSNR